MHLGCSLIPKSLHGGSLSIDRSLTGMLLALRSGVGVTALPLLPPRQHPRGAPLSKMGAGAPVTSRTCRPSDLRFVAKGRFLWFGFCAVQELVVVPITEAGGLCFFSGFLCVKV